MTFHRLSLLPLIALLFYASGCSSDQQPVSHDSRGVSQTFTGAANVTFGDFEVTYQGRTFDGTSTTFAYTVTGPASNMHFRIGWPVTECTNSPTSWSPTNGSTGNNDCCINPGLEWHEPTGNGSYGFSYTFAGDIPEGLVPASVKSNSDLVVGEITGAGVPVYTVSGTVFQDANANAAIDISETFIAGVSIALINGGAVVSTATTDESGNYSLTVECGTYTVELDTFTLTGTQQTYFIPTTSLAYTVTVGPDSPGNDFGFDVNTSKAIADLDNGTLPTTGLTPDFWKREYQAGARGRGGYFPVDSMLAFLDRVEELALATPFVFTGTDLERLDAVYQLLRKPIRTDFEALERELLALELNHAAGFGIDLSTQLILIGWGETLYNDGGSASNPKFGGVQAGTIGTATEVFDGINSNKSPGGGGSR